MTLPLFPNASAGEKADLYCDGASSGNPGRAGIGVVLRIGNHRINISEFLGIATNNVAEYRALIRGLKEALHHGITSLRIYSDSELLVKQIKGEYKTKHPMLLPLNAEVKELLGLFASYSIEHIPREHNKDADSLAKRAITERRVTKSTHTKSA